jgi:hypothetical protein
VCDGCAQAGSYRVYIKLIPLVQGEVKVSSSLAKFGAVKGCASRGACSSYSTRNISPSRRTGHVSHGQHLRPHIIALPSNTLHPAHSLVSVASHSRPPPRRLFTSCSVARLHQSQGASPPAPHPPQLGPQACRQGFFTPTFDTPTLPRFHECRYTNMSTPLALAIATFLEHPIS